MQYTLVYMGLMEWFISIEIIKLPIMSHMTFDEVTVH